MASALIGHTGFVGGNLARQREFDEFYNSKNIEEIAGRGFDLVICSGAPAEKWKANKDPLTDQRGLDRLWAALRQASAAKVVLISTVDVYARPDGVDENDAVDRSHATPYGQHRYDLERRVADHFDTLTVRLPGLFGEGLKKNVVYDFLNRNNLDQIDSRSVFQFYGLTHLWRDVATSLEAGLHVVNFATAPTSVRRVALHAFGLDFANEPPRAPVCYDFRTRHHQVFGGAGGYIATESQVLDEVRAYVVAERGARRCA